ncbi:MAG: 2-C-methyl-D-erythritol 4-phosphate cytidylyltransferase [Bacteroidales bacterium]|nr:2-C-methyl-D-erythritol 4-phosphate cytidylyltransferase [Bacteroidales bacterium]MDD4175584.1 2-C-methyl-D-erythritol 4-phosphate cytidylyltransferase [Bacteroidales bacterium]
MDTSHQKYAIIVAGGSGARMGYVVPKQFLLLAGKPLLMHTLIRFREAISELQLIVVLPFDHIETWQRLCSEHRFSIPHQMVAGGRERFFSVRNGLEKITAAGWVAVHDGVRPLVSAKLIQMAFEAAARDGSAIPVITPTESLRQITGNGSHSVNRTEHRLVQTPQVFDAQRLAEAYRQPFRTDFTDDATVWEAANNKVHLIEGELNNIKITRPFDLLLAEQYLHYESEES